MKENIEKNIENNTESKFGSFLNFMKKFLAMSFFCAIAAFGFGALHAQAVIDTNDAANYTTVDAKSGGKTISKEISEELKKYDEKEDVLYYREGGPGTNNLEAYALRRENIGGEAKIAKDDTTAKTNEEIKNLKISTQTQGQNDVVNKINTQLITDGVENLTIQGYTNTDTSDDKVGNVTVEGTLPGLGGKKLSTLTVLTSDGKAVNRSTLANAKTYFTTTKPVADKVTTQTTLKLDNNKVRIDGSITDESAKKEAVKTELANLKVKKIENDNEVEGTWGVPSDITDDKCTAEFTPTDATIAPETFEIEVATYSPEEEKIKEKFGEPITFGDHTFYEKNGKTSVVLKNSGISWLREASGGTDAWYGFENSDKDNPALPEGSVVSVQWYNSRDPEYKEKLKEATKGLSTLKIIPEDDKIWIFELDAYKKTESGDYEQVSAFDGKKIKVYIELGRDWDMSDIGAIWSDQAEKRTTKIVEEEINGVKKHFVRLELDHFSQYAVYDEQKARDILDKLNEIGEKAKADYLAEHPDAKDTELAKVAEEAITKAYDELSQEEKDQLAEYMNNEMKKLTESMQKDSKKDTTPGGSGSSSNSSSSNKSSNSSSSSSKIKTGKNEALLALLLFYSGGALPLSVALRKKYFNF